MTIVTLVSGCGNAYPGDGTRDGGGQGGRSGEQHANGWRVSRHRLVADVTVGVIANPMSGRDIRRLVASASVFSNAEAMATALLVAPKPDHHAGLLRIQCRVAPA